MSMNRRQFIRYGAVGAAATGLTARSWSQVVGANGDIRHAVVGFNGQGRSHIEGFSGVAGVRIAGLCDADSAVLDREAGKLKQKNQPALTFTDVRKLLDSKEIDTISIATPNHWHSLMAIWGVQAGKDVYVEKPVSHNVWEGRKVVEAARAHKRIVQTGTQCRSNPGMREAVEFLQKGGLGKILVARGLCYKRRASIGKVAAAQQPPASVDYNLWCGPAPMEPLMRSRLHYDWHWVWPTGNGDLGNQGIHQMDIARWILQADALSPEVLSVGGRVGYDDDGNTPNTQFILHAYPSAPLIFEVRGLPAREGENKMDAYRGSSIGVVVDCENGYMVIPNYHSGTAYDKAGNELKKFNGQASHHANFIKAVRSRKVEDLNADILEGHLSSALCHTGNISYRLGVHKKPGEILESIKGDKNAADCFGRMMEHLGANGLDTKETGLMLGHHLKMDPKTERFTNNPAANELLTRRYRAPFIVPEKV